ncbi:MAG: DUF308 domain-containing protein [Clostridia bacterium]|nr:DUF308 domain-containing protein [Clostridia bacterium]
MKFNRNNDPAKKKDGLWQHIGIAVAALAAGVLLIVARSASERIIARIFAILIALSGAAHIGLKAFKGAHLLPTKDFASGVTVFALGFYLIFKPAILSGILTVLLAIALIYVGFSMLERAFGFWKLQARRWWIPAACAAPVLVMGFFALFYPARAADGKWIFLGIALLVVAVLEVVSIVLHRRADIVFGNTAPVGTQAPQAPAAPATAEAPQQPAASAPAPASEENK